jgi:putative ABC transport system permease protein
MKQEPMWRRYARMFGANPRGDTDDELSFHYEMRVRDYMRKGMDEASARVAAGERLGDIESVKRECVEQGDRYVREDRRREWFGEFRQDLKYGARVLLRTPVFAFVAVITLALGVGVTTAVFSVVNRVLLAPLPYPQPDRLVNIYEHSPQGDDHNPVSPGNVLDWIARAKSFEQIGAYQGSYGIALTGGGEPVQVVATHFMPSALRALSPRPTLGRLFDDEDVGKPVVLISHSLWQSRFGGDRAILGKTMVLNGTTFPIIGVLPASFEYPDASIQVWLPLNATQLDPIERRSHNFHMVARLAPAVSIEQAQAEMKALSIGLAREHPQHMTGWGVNVVALHNDLTTDVRTLLYVLFGTVVVVLLIACGNLANLLLARAVARESEMAVRGALGAGRGRIARQLLTESLLIAMLGGAVGLAFAWIALRGVLAAAPANIPMLSQVTLDWSVLAFAAAVTLTSTILFGLVPALRSSRANLQTTLRARGASVVRHARVRAALLVMEVALSVVLLVGAGLLVRSFQQLQRTDLGYRHRGLALLEIVLPNSRYSTVERQVAFFDQLVEQLRSLPGVQAVGGTVHAPASGRGMTFSFAIEGRPAANPTGREDPEQLHVVTPEFFRSAGLPIIAGRDFDTRDRADQKPVVIINQALARKHWPNESPIGKRISFRPGETPWLEIVGLVGDTRWESPDAEPERTLYIPHAQKSWSWMSWMGLMIRLAPGTTLDQARPRVQAALWQMDDQLPVQGFTTLEALYGESISRRTFAMRLVLIFACLALTLSIVGLYGLMAYAVAQQKQSFGVRLALGARPAAVVRMVLADSLRMAGLGLAIGIVAAIWTTRYLTALLYEVKPTDPITMGAIALIVLATTLFATWIPARRAVRVDPLTALRGA